MQQFSTEQWLPHPRDVVFAFFANPANLPPLMPRWQHARVEEITLCPPPPRPESTRVFSTPAAGSGTRLTITARAIPLVPVRGTWLAEIQDFRWNEAFCDVQLRGPFAFWRHCHHVRDSRREDGTPGTVVRDDVRYALPLEAMTRMAYPAMQQALAALFRYRQARTVELIGGFATEAGSQTSV